MEQRVVTVLFTDVEGSTRLWEIEPKRMPLALARHDALLRQAVILHKGTVVKMTGDGIHAIFDDPLDGMLAAIALQRALAEVESEDTLVLRVRVGLHVGAVQHRDNDYFGATANRAARIMASAHGGQILLSQAIADLTRDRLPNKISLRDLGLARLRDLASPERVFGLLAPGLPQDFPPLRGLDSTPHNLPQQASSFVGRKHEIAEIRKLLGSHRLVTVVGPGGVGKTRLSLQVAVSLLDEYPDGAWFVELASIAEPSLVTRTVAQTLSVREKPDEPIERTLLEQLASRRVLIVLDNCEHLLEVCAQLIARILAATSGVDVLVSGRAPLRVAGERRYPLSALSLHRTRAVDGKRSASDAAQLFTERTLGHRPDFVLTDRAADVVEQICERLDGIPLAIELAAARTPTLSVDEIHARLDERFKLLTLGSRGAVPRQQTLHALVNWSYELLGRSEQRLLARVSVFVGGFEVTAAEQVCAYGPIAIAEILDLLASLVEKSLLVVDTNGVTTRYRQLETIREFARERLLEFDEIESITERHAEHFRRLAREGHAALLGPGIADWIERIASEHDNLRAALNWATHRARSALIGLDLAGHLYRFWQIQRHLTEGRDRLRAVLDRPNAGEPTPERARALHAAGILASAQNDDTEARRLLGASLELFRRQGDELGLAATLSSLASVDPERAPEYRSQALDICTAHGDRVGAAQVLIGLGLAAMDDGDWATGTQYVDRAIALCRELGNVNLQVTCELSLGFVKLRHSRPREAGEHFRRSREIASASRLLPNLVSACRGLALAASELQDWPTACNAVRAVFSARTELPSTSQADLPRDLLADSLYVCARFAWAINDFEAALRLLATSHALGPWKSEVGRFSTQSFERERQALFELVTDQKAEAVWNTALSWSIEEAVQFAIARLDALQQSQPD